MYNVKISTFTAAGVSHLTTVLVLIPYTNVIISVSFGNMHIFRFYINSSDCIHQR